MRKAPPLPYWTFVVDLPDTCCKSIVQRRFPDNDALFRGLFRFISRLKAKLLRPPVVERRNRKDGEIIPFHRIAVLGRSFRGFLQKSKEINSRIRFTQRSQYVSGVIKILVLFRLESANAN